MRKIYGIGETVYDIIFKNGQPVSATPGGSVLNAMVSLARLGNNVNFISELGDDEIGNIIISFLKKNNINTDFISKYKNGQSAIAMAFLNKNNDAEYEFYKNYPEDRLHISLPDFKENDILIFGSSYAIDQKIRKQLIKILGHAKKCGCIIIYDPNYRKKHKTSLLDIQENIKFADIIRASDEDMNNLFASSNSNEAYEMVKKHCSNLIYTQSSQGVDLHTQSNHKHFAINPIKPVSTIGAGDNFNAGIAHAIIKNNINIDDINKLSDAQWKSLIDSGINLSSKVCMLMDNYIG